MKVQRNSAIWSSSLLLLVFAFASFTTALSQDKKPSKYVCAEPNPASMCNAGNTCGTASSPCSVDVKRTGAGNSASTTPSVPGAKGNMLFCVHSGTSVEFMTSAKNVGFVIDFGPTTPFGSDDAIIGGAKKSVTVAANKQGCYKYSVGACTSGTVYGMCGQGSAELIVVP